MKHLQRGTDLKIEDRKEPCKNEHLRRNKNIKAVIKKNN
jgi:hypothetical protein